VSTTMRMIAAATVIAAMFMSATRAIEATRAPPFLRAVRGHRQPSLYQGQRVYSLPFALLFVSGV
jgi:hypothetical protein